MQLLTTLNSAQSDHCRFKWHQLGWGRTAFDEQSECNWSPSYKIDGMDSFLSGCVAVSLGNRSRRFETWWPHLKSSKRLRRTGHFRQLKMRSLRSRNVGNGLASEAASNPERTKPQTRKTDVFKTSAVTKKCSEKEKRQSRHLTLDAFLTERLLRDKKMQPLTASCHCKPTRDQQSLLLCTYYHDHWHYKAFFTAS